MATLLLSVLGAFAEFERTLIRERQRRRSFDTGSPYHPRKNND